MHLFTVTEPVALSSKRIIKYSAPAPGGEQLPVGRVYLLGSGDLERLKEQLTEQQGEGAFERIVRIIDDASMEGWHKFPPRLGRFSLGLGATRTPVLHTQEPEPLRSQLPQLLERVGTRGHLRLALVNGFGANLGDSLTGATALRVLLRELRNYLPSFSMDVLLGLDSHPDLCDLLRVGPEIEREYWGSITLSDFARYDAYFDFSGLISYPRYYDLPAVDFCLWWLGLDPDQVAPADKRNHLHVTASAREEVAHLLAPLQRPLLLFNHKASVPLRSFPEQQALSFISALRAQAPEYTIVLNHALAHADPRVVDLSGSITTVERLKALVGQVDGVLTVETFALHLADACAVPTVVFVASTPVMNSVRNYPHCTGMQLPGAESLPGWRQAKVAKEQWPTMAQAYEAAWAQVSATEALQHLRALQTAHAQTLLEAPSQASVAAPAVRPSFAALETDTYPPRLRPLRLGLNAAWMKEQSALYAVARRTLRLGGVAVLAGGGTGEMAVGLARRLGCDGSLHVFEPRRLFHQLLCANVMLADIDWVHTYQALPMPAPVVGGMLELNDLDLFSWHHEDTQGNLHRRVAMECKPLDALDLPVCQLLLIQQWLSAHDVVLGARELLARTRPVVLVARAPSESVAQLVADFEGLQYRLFIKRPTDTPTARPASLAFLPAELAEELVEHLQEWNEHQLPGSHQA